MILLGLPTAVGATAAHPGEALAEHLVLVFGVGMIGQAIVEALLRIGFEQRADIAYPWDDARRRPLVDDAIMAICRSLTRQRQPRLSMVWSAGRGGFLSSAAELEDEHRAFAAALELAQRLREEAQPAGFAVHYLSSAGGLFEGQQAIGRDAQPAPRRPYGIMKLRQELLLRKSMPERAVYIYRPSSVYGPHASNRRHGLINHLVSNGRRGRPTVLDARVMALRDYVFAGDIGTYIGRRIRFGAPGCDAPNPELLVSARCASIFEVVRKIERVLKLKLSVRYDEHFGNHSHITFSERVLPAGWRPSPLEVGIRQFLLHPAH